MTSELRFYDVCRSEVIILEKKLLVMNIPQAEKKVYTFHTVFRVDVNDVKPFQNPTETSPFDHFLDPQYMPRLFKSINMVDSNLAFIDPVSAAYYGGSGSQWLRAHQNDYVIDNCIEPALI